LFYFFPAAIVDWFFMRRGVGKACTGRQVVLVLRWLAAENRDKKRC